MILCYLFSPFFFFLLAVVRNDVIFLEKYHLRTLYCNISVSWLINYIRPGHILEHYSVHSVLWRSESDSKYTSFLINICWEQIWRMSSMHLLSSLFVHPWCIKIWRLVYHTFVVWYRELRLFHRWHTGTFLFAA